MYLQLTESIDQTVALVIGIQLEYLWPTGVDRSFYTGYRTEQEDYATLGSITPPSSNIGMIVRPKTKSVSSHGSHMPKGNVEGQRAASSSSHPIIGESAAMFTDMTDTMLKVLDRRMAITAQPENWKIL